MSNNRPPGGNRPPGSNKPPSQGGFPGGQRPPINNGLNSWSGPTWADRNAPSGRPPRFQPPKSSPFPKNPPKPPGFKPPFKPPIKPPGGKLGFMKGGLPGLALMGGLMFLDWWLNQPPPPPPSLPPSPANPLRLRPGVTYQVFLQGRDWFDRIHGYQGLSASGGMIESFFVTGPFSLERVGGYGFASRQSGFLVWGHRVFLNVNGSRINEMGSETPEDVRTIVGYKPGSIKVVKIVEVSTNKTQEESEQPPAPNYTINNNFNTTYNFAPPVTRPTPNNPAPLSNPPGTNPPFTPFPKPGQNPTGNPGENPNNDDDLPPFPGFRPFPYTPPFGSPFDNPTSRPGDQFVVNDPVLETFKKPGFGLGTSPNINTNTNTTTNPNTNTNTNTTTNPNTNTNTTTNPTTNPPPNPTPFPNPNPTPFPPGFVPFPPTNPKDPVIDDEPKTPPPPTQQTPAGNNCCVPTPVSQKLDEISNRLNPVDLIDLALLGVINNKLGPQVNGGLSGFLQDRFTKLWKSRVIDRALNLMATAAAIHNGVMLSRNIGGTLVQTLANSLAIIGIKDGDEIAQSFSSVIGDSIENIIKGLVGAENYQTLTEVWAKANRIYQSAINIYQLMTDSLFGITEGLEMTAKYTGKIGNALKQSGVVLENAYSWMSEAFNFSSGKNRKIDRVIEGLQQANEVASDLESITAEFRGARENIDAIGAEVDVIKTEINGKEDEKKDKETQSKTESQSPTINRTDLVNPNS